MKYFNIICFCLTLIGTTLKGQFVHQGLPYIANYTSEQYNTIDQNWTAIQDNFGRMYFGNTNGILCYDGYTWKLIPISNYMSIIRDMAIDSTGKLYCGSINNFGYLNYDEDFNYEYISLSEQLTDEKQNFNDIWRVGSKNNFVYFMSKKYLFIYQDLKLKKTIKARGEFIYFEEFKGKFLIQDKGIGLFLVDKQRLFPIDEAILLNNMHIAAITNHDTYSYIMTKKNGIFRLSDSTLELKHIKSDILKNSTITCGLRTKDNQIVIGTENSGIVFLDSTLDIIGAIDQSHELLSNDVNSLYLDNSNNLWALTSNGITYIEINSPFSYFTKAVGLNSMLTTSAYYKNKLFAAGIDGVYFLEINKEFKKNNRFKFIKESKGQNWQMVLKNDLLIVAHNPGLVIIDDKNVWNKLLDGNNVYCLVTPPIENQIIASGQNCLLMVNIFDFSYKKIGDLPETPRYMELGMQKDIWFISETLKGIYKLEFDDNYQNIISEKHYHTNDGLPNKALLSILKTNEKINVLTEMGFYEYNYSEDTFKPNHNINSYYNNQAYLANTDLHGNVWLGGLNFISLLKRNGTNYELIDTIFQRIRNYSFFNVNSLSEHTWGLASNKGLIHFNSEHRFFQSSFTTMINEVKSIGNDSVISKGIYKLNRDRTTILQPDSLIPILKYKENSLRFSFSTNDYVEPQRILFSCKLVKNRESNNEWTNWTNEHFKEYTNLTEGTYTFCVRAKNVYGKRSTEATFTFEIFPPWYRTNWSYFGYGIILILLFMSGARIYSIRLQKLNSRLDRIIKQRTKEIQQQKEEIQQQKEEIEQQKEEILTDRDNLKTMAMQLQELDRFKSKFFTNISHELRTPLTLIISPLEQLNENRKEKELNPLFSIMLRNAKRLLNLINQLLFLSKIEKGIVKLNLDYAEINSFISNLIYDFSLYTNEKNINLQLNLSKESIWLYFDKDIMEKIIDNLLSNAIKFTDEGGTIKITTELIDNEKNFLLSISDTGQGIPENELERIFDRFYQLPANKKNHVEGTGIGLSFVKELMEIHLGHIAVKSVLGQGTEFSLVFPTEKSVYSQNANFLDAKEPETQAEKSEEKANEEIENTHPSAEKEIILIVEDNDDMQRFIASSLPKHYDIIHAPDGKKGFEKATEEIPDLIITDVMMPIMNGVEMTRRIKQDSRTSHIPIIMLTAKTSENSKIEGFEAMVDEYLTKPFSIRELTIRVKNLLTLRNQLKRKYQDELLINPADVTTTSIDQIFLTKAISSVEKNMSNDEFGIDFLCNELAMSRATLHRKIKALTNQSTSEFINGIRLKHAARLIRQNAGSISEIAYQVGFNNISYFNVSFKKQFGVSPSEFK